jgi:hypothetical protein
MAPQSKRKTMTLMARHRPRLSHWSTRSQAAIAALSARKVAAFSAVGACCICGFLAKFCAVATL